MLWPTYWPKALLLLTLAFFEGQSWSAHNNAGVANAAPWSTQRKLEFRNATRDLWYHGFNSYMRFAFPLDELAPLSCSGRGPNWGNPTDISANDVAGNFSVTLLDVLDTFVVLNDTAGFENAVRNVIDWVSFDVNTKPQVFETTIRAMGGLLSGHQFASQPGQPFHIPWYRGQLLSLAHDLGKRLLPAFKTPTGLPYARINLRHGLEYAESVDTCTAGAGSLILEFGTLSRLTGDDRFEKAAYKAFFALWNQRSDIGLVGNTVNIINGAWTSPEVNGIGAGIDSFYEYALKWYILSGEVEFLDVFQEAYAAVMRYTRSPDGFWYRSTNIHTGDPAYLMVDSLSAFWPGLQVLAGDIENAIKSHMIYWNLWKKFQGLPEVWDMNWKMATSLQYPLRPEFVESTWYLYRATKDPFYLDVGERILLDITTRAKVNCGLTGIGDLRNNQRDDRMESFVLSETLKYLYLLFDEHNTLHSDDSNMILTTEGHLLGLDKSLHKPISAIRREMRRVEHLQCPAYHPPLAAQSAYTENSLVANIYFRSDIDYARTLVTASPSRIEESSWSPYGWCQIPKVQLYSYDFLLTSDGSSVTEDLNPTSKKLMPVSDGYILHNVSGIRAHVVSRMDGKGYDITKLGPYSVKTGQVVYVNDTNLVLSPVDGEASSYMKRRAPDVELRVFIDFLGQPDGAFQLQHDIPTEAFVTASTALFGGDPTISHPPEKVLQFGRGEGTGVVRDPSNSYGCAPYTQRFPDQAILVQRGECTFLEKLVEAVLAGASGVIAVSDEDRAVTPSATFEDLQAVGDAVDDATVVVVSREDGELITSMLDAADKLGGHVVVAVSPMGHSSGGGQDPTLSLEEQRARARDGNRVLYLNGHPLVNTRLMI